jgi:hypothetical protein
LQRLKGGGTRPAYKPSLAVHESGLIVGVDPSSERSAVMPILKQHQAIFDAPPARLLLDGGYPSLALRGDEVAEELKQRETRLAKIRAAM